MRLVDVFLIGIWLLIALLTAASFKVALWLRSKGVVPLLGGFAVLLVVDAVALIFFPVIQLASGAFAVLILGTTGGYLLVLLLRPIQALARWLEKNVYNS